VAFRAVRRQLVNNPPPPIDSDRKTVGKVGLPVIRQQFRLDTPLNYLLTFFLFVSQIIC
jgi:hypothetical protein